MPTDTVYAVQMRSISKLFGSFTALDNVLLEVKRGSVHALLGENGAGKSTLMNILYGLYQPDKGDIYLYGDKISIKNPNVAIEHGIGMVHQHFKLIDNFTVTENIVLGKEVTKNFGFLDKRRAKKKVLDIIDKYGLYVDPDSNIEDVSVGMQQRVEILKALYRGADILILDEPTAVLTPQETDELIKIMKSLVKYGKTIIIITHKLKEIKTCADKCTIIRQGKYVDTVTVADVTKDELATMMVGRKINLNVKKEKSKPKGTVFEINDLVVKDERGIERVKNLSLKVRAGEIIGLAGIDGNGQKELVEAIACLTKCESGTIKINNKEVQNTNTLNVLKNNICIVHEDRIKNGIILDFTVSENAVLEQYKSEPFSKDTVLNNSEVSKFTREIIEDYHIRPNNCENLQIASLSGGNQQKLVIAREIANEPDLLIVVQPTRGLDAGAIEYVHSILVEERDKGKAILLISLELDEIMSLSDKIAVIYDGYIVETLEQQEANENLIGLLMAGGQINETVV